LSHVRVDVPMAARAPGLTLTLDGAEVQEAAWGAEMPVDPGRHDLGASAPGRMPWKKSVEVGVSDSRVVEIPPLAVEAAPQAPVPPAPNVAAQPAPSSGRRAVGLVIAGVGIASIAVGSVFGVTAIRKRHDAEGACLSAGCGSDAHSLNDEGVRDAWIAVFTIGGGIAAAAVGTYLIVSAPSATRGQALRATFTGRGLNVVGDW
jgi:hypothetical protein